MMTDNKVVNNLPLKPKRILYVENGIGYGGAIICLRHLVRNLDRDRFTPMVVTGRTGPQYREIAGEAKWKHIPDRYLDITRAQQKIACASWPDKIPGARFILNQLLGRSDDLANFLPLLVRILITARSFKADLIHVNNEPLCNRAALLAGKLLKIPTVCHVRGNLEANSKIMKWAFSLPDYFTPVSAWVSRNIQNKFHVDAKKISVIYDGLELDNLDPTIDGRLFREKYQIADSHFAVGLVGLLIPWKGQEIFIDAAKLLKEKIPELKMVIVGGTPDDCIAYEQHLRRRIIDEGLSNTVIFTGHVTDMPAVYNGLNIVVSASTSPEPLGTVVIESMVMGRPLIGPNHGGAAEMMEHGKTGLLFEPGNAEELASVISQFHGNAELRNNLGKAAREKALNTFTVEEHVRQVQNVYSLILKQELQNSR